MNRKEFPHLQEWCGESSLGSELLPWVGWEWMGCRKQVY